MHDIGHFLIVGKTRYGKTTAGKQIAADFKKTGKGIVALSAMPEEWRQLADYATGDQDEFTFLALNKFTNCLVIVDECSEMSGTYNKTTSRLFTRGRHRGHVCMAIGQCATQINPDIRRNCSSLILFKSSMDDCRILNQVFVDDAIFQAPTLQKGECIVIIEDQPAVRRAVF